MTAADWAILTPTIVAFLGALAAWINSMVAKKTANAAANQSVQNAVNLQNHTIEEHDKLN